MLFEVEEKMLKKLKSKGRWVVMFLRNGAVVCGVVEDYDDAVVLVREHEKLSMVYRDVISTIRTDTKEG